MRKPLKNFLDMVPVRNVGEFVRENDKITLLIPKFKSAWMLKWLIPPRRSRHFRIHLDVTGSRVWELIDGKRNTQEICTLLSESYPQMAEVENGPEIRVTSFLRNLYKNRFIVFR